MKISMKASVAWQYRKRDNEKQWRIKAKLINNQYQSMKWRHQW
jgi:hypothetical protein